MTLENRSEEDVTYYYQIDYILTAVPEECAYFHTPSSGESIPAHKEVYPPSRRRARQEATMWGPT